jgi:uncharacterized phage-associated protein
LGLISETSATSPAFVTYDARGVANYILDRCEELGRTVSNLSIQKLIFFCHAWTLKVLSRPLVGEEFEAWQLGPVLPYLYREFKDFEERPITKRATKLDKATGTRVIATYNFDPELLNLLTQTIDTYSALTPYQLVAISHANGGPWDQVWNHGKKINAGMRISNMSISNFYSARTDSSLPPMR